MKNRVHPFYEKNRECLGNILPLNTPFTVFIDLSEVCNFRCNYCFRSNTSLKQYGYALQNNLMNWETFIRTIEQIEEFPCEVKKISLSGHGEPLCNKLLPEMVKYIKRKGIKALIEIHTNAALLNEEYVKALLDSQIDKINISLQGMSSRKYKEICQANIDFEDYYNKLKLLFQNRTNTTINIKIADIALEKNEKELFYEKFEKIADNIYIEEIVPLWESLDYSGLVDKNKFNQNKFGQEINYQKSCSFTFYTLFITPNGDIYPCTQPLVALKLGNIYSTTLKNAWNSQLRQDFLINHLKYGRQTIENCNDCYIAQNSIMTKEDSINEYTEEILGRLWRGNSYD
ncbi:radical SAM/SPASM domain-containing protein [Aminipila sp.]|uniref:radical SAM/SPASM domain-containing protein n=1 Tax=Aminipila sp. TaxID=2060095 RepID=UPI00289A4974|nr:radical SAM protein [Aminipila sp.]